MEYRTGIYYHKHNGEIEILKGDHIMLSYALQLYSVRDDMAADFEGTLKKVKEMGYQGVEFAGLYDHSAEEVKKMLHKLELTAVSAHVPYVEMLADPDKVMSDYAEIGCRYIAVPYLEEQYRPGTDAFPGVIENIKMFGEAAKKHRLMLLYHNHDFEFVKINGKYALDILYDSVSPDLLQTEIDTCWANVAGADPSEYILKYSGRTSVVHLKDFSMPGKKPSKMYALIGLDDNEKQQSGGAFEFRPVGYGAQDIPSILHASEKAGAVWAVVEQDNPSLGQSPLECAKMSIDYLTTIE